MKKVSIQQMRDIDNQTINVYGIPAQVLMDHAGKAVADEIVKLLSGKLYKIAVFSGPGNNGGDGLAAIRWLYHYGHNVEIFFIGDLEKASLETRLNLSIAENLNIKIHRINNSNISVINNINCFDLAIDALLGTGSYGLIRGLYAEIISILNSSNIKIVSIDIPSGLNADNGQILGSCIKAHMTVTIGFPKIGFDNPTALAYTGKIIIADIGLLD